MEALSTSQSGKIAEYFLACAVMSVSTGRLSPFLPASDDHGIDLIVMDKATAASVAVQVKSWRTSKGTERPTVQFDVRKATFLSSPRVALVAMVLSPDSLAMELGWVIPMPRVPELAVEQASKFALSPSRSPASADRYAPFRHMDIVGLVEAIGNLI